MNLGVGDVTRNSVRTRARRRPCSAAGLTKPEVELPMPKSPHPCATSSCTGLRGLFGA
jgi:hypothetical protein